MKIALASDHVGRQLKLELAERLTELGYEWHDFGPFSDERTDYPLYGSTAARAVAAGEYDRAILVCGTGVGISISANKVDGIRCVVCSEPFSAQLSREHNDTNALALGSRVVSGGLALMIMEAWLTGEYEGGRHARRVAQLAALDAGEILELPEDASSCG